MSTDQVKNDLIALKIKTACNNLAPNGPYKIKISQIKDELLEMLSVQDKVFESLKNAKNKKIEETILKNDYCDVVYMWMIEIKNINYI